MNHLHEVSRSFATVCEMLEDRGLDASSARALSGQDIVALGGTRSVFSVDLPSCDVRLVWDVSPRFKLASVRKLLEAGAGGPKTAIVIARSLKGVALKGAEDLGREVEFFALGELQFNISKHVLVPKHRPVREEADIADIMQRYSLKSRFQLPLILSTDPMARYLALKPGQLVHVTRTSPSAGHYELYRCCQRG